MNSTESAFLSALAHIVGPQYLLTQPDDCAPYETDWRGRYRGRARAVVRPADVAQVAAVAAERAAR